MSASPAGPPQPKAAAPAPRQETRRDLIALASNSAIVMGFYVALGLWRGARFFWIPWAAAAALAIAYLWRRFALLRRGQAGAASGADALLQLGWILCSVAALALAFFRI